ncbi:MAG: DUF6472 family protein [Lachnospiraceae bacterium]|nr:DUF6472 family protein [Lachnospiraceae bacterium]
MADQCSLCAHNWIDDEDGTEECMVNIDEDDYARMMMSPRESCPYFVLDDEYKLVRHQM